MNADQQQAWMEAMAGRVREIQAKDRAVWFDAIDKRARPWRHVERRNGIFYPKKREEYDLLPEGAVYEVPDEEQHDWWADQSQRRIQPFRAKNTKAHRPQSYFDRQILPWGRPKENDTPVTLAMNPETGNYEPIDPVAKNKIEEIRSMSTTVSGNPVPAACVFTPSATVPAAEFLADFGPRGKRPKPQ